MNIWNRRPDQLFWMWLPLWIIFIRLLYLTIAFYCVRGTPWSAANRLYGQRTGAFSWRPVFVLSRKPDQFRLDPTQSCAPGWWCDRESSVYHIALEMYSGISRHATNLLALSRMPTKHQLHPCPHPTNHSHDYHTHTPTVTTPTAFHTQL